MSFFFFLLLENKLNVAFFCYMNQNQTASPNLTLIFDGFRTNPGNHYNRSSGIFTAPQTRMYVFAWTVYCEAGGQYFLQVVVNNIVYTGSNCNANGALWHRSVSGTLVAQIYQGDAVYIRTHPKASYKGSIVSNSFHRSSFAGWSLF